MRLLGQVRPARSVTTVTIERSEGGGSWTRQARVRTTRDGSFALVVRPTATTSYRARWDGGSGAAKRTSLATVVRVR